MTVKDNYRIFSERITPRIDEALTKITSIENNISDIANIVAEFLI